jgi:uncharacterized protein YvpB
MSIAKKLIKPTCEAHRLHNKSVAMQAKEILRQKQIDAIEAIIYRSECETTSAAERLYDAGARVSI